MKDFYRVIIDRTKSLKRRLLVTGFVFISTLFITGCMVIPTPEYNSGAARTNIKKEVPSQFELRKTSRTDIILALGEPDAVSPDERMLAFRSEKIRGFWFFGAGNSGTGGPITKDLYLVAEFDEHGILEKLESSSHWFTSADSTKMLHVATDTSVTTATNVISNVRIQKPAYWLVGVDGFKSPGSTGMIGLQGQLWVSDVDLQFFADVVKGEFANIKRSGPDLILPFDTITEVRMDKFFLGRCLVVWSRAGTVHSFRFVKGITDDREATQTIAELLLSKIKH